MENFLHYAPVLFIVAFILLVALGVCSQRLQKDKKDKSSRSEEEQPDDSSENK